MIDPGVSAGPGEDDVVVGQCRSGAEICTSTIFPVQDPSTRSESSS